MNAVNAIVVPNGKSTTRPLYQWDYGQRLTLLGYELPDSYEVHFSNTEDGTATIQIGDSTGVDIPDTYLTTGSDVWAWLYLHTGSADGETKATIRIPVRKRAQPTGGSPTPAQQDTITQAIALLNTAVEETSADAESAHADAQRAETAAENLEGVVRYTEQTLTEEQKAQARTNIGVTGGYEPFLVTANAISGTLTVDKGAVEIFEAYTAGKYVYAEIILSGGAIIAPLTKISAIEMMGKLDYYVDFGVTIYNSATQANFYGVRGTKRSNKTNTTWTLDKYHIAWESFS